MDGSQVTLKFLKLEIGADGVATLTLDNPKRHNAVNFAMWSALPDVLRSIENDGSIRVLILTGAGERSFCSGNDVSEFAAVRKTPEQIDHYNALQRIVCDRLSALSKPSIAMIDGYCLGAGLEFALLCDFRLCTPASRFAVPAAKLGLPYRYEDIVKLLDVIGPARTRELVLAGRQIDGKRASEIGMVHDLLPSRAALVSAVDALAQELRENAPLSVAAAKVTLREALARGREADLALCEKLADACYASYDYEEGRTAFRNKRKPQFLGR